MDISIIKRIQFNIECTHGLNNYNFFWMRACALDFNSFYVSYLCLFCSCFVSCWKRNIILNVTIYCFEEQYQRTCVAVFAEQFISSDGKLFQFFEAHLVSKFCIHRIFSWCSKSRLKLQIIVNQKRFVIITSLLILKRGTITCRIIIKYCFE